MRRGELRQDLKHKKWTLINKEGLTIQEANERIQQIMFWENQGHKIAKQEKKASKTDFKTDYERMVKR